jgi:hypothetical protein
LVASFLLKLQEKFSLSEELNEMEKCYFSLIDLAAKLLTCFHPYSFQESLVFDLLFIVLFAIELLPNPLKLLLASGLGTDGLKLLQSSWK